ncbi:MAG: hypothetical protein ACSNEK_08190 [Parachlamydiaceae bacterium]
MDLYLNFLIFKENNPDWENEFGIIQRDSAKFKRIICRWKENKNHVHIFLATINVETGEVYLDCRRRKILAKHLSLAVTRPIFTLIRLIWHLTIIGPLSVEAMELSKEIKKEKEKKNFQQHELRNHVFKLLSISMLRNFVDILRTPMYGAAMTIVSIVALPLGVFNPNSLYTTRAIVGRLERRLLRVNNGITRDSCNLNHKSLSPCFSPIEEMFPADLTAPPSKQELKDTFERLAHANVRFRKSSRAIFNDCFHLLKEDQTYVSAAAKTKKLIKVID